MTAEPRVLVEKLNPVCRRALEQGAELCVTRTHYAVEAEHLLVRLLEEPRSDLVALLRHYDVSDAVCLAELTRGLDRLEGGNRATPSLSLPLLRWMERAWVVSSLRLGEAHIRSGALLLALLDDEFLRGRMAGAGAPTLMGVPREPLRDHLRGLLGGVPEGGSLTASAVREGAPWR